MAKRKTMELLHGREAGFCNIRKRKAGFRHVKMHHKAIPLGRSPQS